MFENVFSRWFGKRDRRRRIDRAHLATLVPPPRLTKSHGREQFRQIGSNWFDTFRELGGLRPCDDILDVGCGPGRMALTIASYLNEDALYRGFDVDHEAIKWSQSNITPHWPNAEFQCFDIQNGLYNPDSGTDPSTFRFPYASESFDFVVLTSVFTHFREQHMVNYLHEIARVLRPRGRALITYFLVNDAVKQSVQNGLARYSHLERIGESSFAIAPGIAEEAIGLDEGFVKRQYASARLSIDNPICRGRWSATATGPTRIHYQDIIVARK